MPSGVLHHEGEARETKSTVFDEAEVRSAGLQFQECVACSGPLEAAAAEIVLEGQHHAAAQPGFQPTQHTADVTEWLGIDPDKGNFVGQLIGFCKLAVFNPDHWTSAPRNAGQEAAPSKHLFADHRCLSDPSRMKVACRAGFGDAIEVSNSPEPSIQWLSLNGFPCQRKALELLAAEFDVVPFNAIEMQQSESSAQEQSRFATIHRALDHARNDLPHRLDHWCAAAMIDPGTGLISRSSS